MSWDYKLAGLAGVVGGLMTRTDGKGTSMMIERFDTTLAYLIIPFVCVFLLEDIPEGNVII